MRPRLPLTLPLLLLLACSQSADAPQPAKSAAPSTSAVVARSAAPTASAQPTATSSVAVLVPSSESSEPPPRVSAEQACDAVLKSGLGKVCEVKPNVLGANGAFQLTLPKPAGFTRDIYAGFFTFASADALEKTRVEVTKSDVGAKRPLVITNGKALLLVVVDGEISPTDEARFRKVVDAL